MDNMMQEDDLPTLFNEDSQPFNIVIYSGGTVYCIESDIYMLSYVMRKPEYMFDSQIEDVVNDIFEGADKIYALEEKVEKQLENNISNLNNSFKLDYETVKEYKKCSRCGTSFIDFIQQNKRGCGFCCVDFSDELRLFLNILDEKMNFFSKENKNPDVIYGGSMGIPKTRNVSPDNENKLFKQPVNNPQYDIKTVHDLVKEKEKDFRKRTNKEPEEEIKLNYEKFVKKDKEWIEDQIDKNDKKIKKFIEEKKYKAAEFLEKQTQNLRKSLSDDN